MQKSGLAERVSLWLANGGAVITLCAGNRFELRSGFAAKRNFQIFQTERASDRRRRGWRIVAKSAKNSSWLISTTKLEPIS